MNADDDQRRLFAALNSTVYDELELRTGASLSRGLGEQEIDEFEAIVERDQGRLGSWLLEHVPDFESEPRFARFEQTMPDADPLEVVAEYAALRWLEIYRPDYRVVVLGVQRALARDLMSWLGQQSIAPIDEFVSEPDTDPPA